MHGLLNRLLGRWLLLRRSGLWLGLIRLSFAHRARPYYSHQPSPKPCGEAGSAEGRSPEGGGLRSPRGDPCGFGGSSAATSP
jgi:hypothetical protein